MEKWTESVAHRIFHWTSCVPLNHAATRKRPVCGGEPSNIAPRCVQSASAQRNEASFVIVDGRGSTTHASSVNTLTRMSQRRDIGLEDIGHCLERVSRTRCRLRLWRMSSGY